MIILLIFQSVKEQHVDLNLLIYLKTSAFLLIFNIFVLCSLATYSETSNQSWADVYVLHFSRLCCVFPVCVFCVFHVFCTSDGNAFCWRNGGRHNSPQNDKNAKYANDANAKDTMQMQKTRRRHEFSCILKCLSNQKTDSSPHSIHPCRQTRDATVFQGSTQSSGKMALRQVCEETQMQTLSRQPSSASSFIYCRA